MSPEERSSAKNGIWMCRDHGKAIDSPDPQFTVELLREWKKQAQIASWRRVLRNEAAPGHADVTDAQLAERVHAAAEADLTVFRQTAKWPSTSVALTLKVDDLDEPVTTSALAGAATSLDDLILVAPPGMGKTTTLLQIAEGVLANGKGTPLVVPLGDWATEGAPILESILKRPAFRGIPEDDFRKVAAQPGVVLLLDGWNELDVQARNRARVQITALKAQLPELGLIISTRRQALDVPFGGTRVDLLPLSEAQQMQIAIAIRGDAGAKFVDQAWRTAGVRELVTIPLYLTALLSLPENALFPTTKEEVLRHFVAVHEKEANHAEALYAVAQGFQQDYLDGLAVFATRSSNTAIADSNARQSIFDTESLLADNRQITIKPQPDAVLNVLVSNHVLMRAGDTRGYAFQHQQFQEWYASHSVERRIIAEVDDSRGCETLKAEVFNLPAWEEPILFAIERLAHGDASQRAACGKAIIAAFEVDPILAAEMIFRSTEEVWSQIAATIQGLVARWHAPGKVDRAVRFMLTSGRSEFLDAVWPLITNENDQISLKALRNCRRFRPSILGNDAENKIKTLSPPVRTVLLSEMASRSGMDGLDLATAIAKNDPDPEAQASVVDALSFRRANRHVAEALYNASDKTFDLVVRRDLIDEVDDEQVKKGVAAACERRAVEGTSDYDRLRVIAYAQDDEDHSAELTRIISTMEIDKQHHDAGVQLIYQARNRYLGAIANGLLARVRAGHPVLYCADDILASAGFALEDDALLELALSDAGRHDARAEAAAAVLGPIAVGRMVDAFLDTGARVRVDGKFDQAASDLCAGLQNRIAHVPGTSLVAAVLARSAQADNEQMTRLAELLSRHSDGETERGRPFDAAALPSIRGLVEDWGNRMLASDNAERRQKASIGTLAGHVPSVDLLPILKRLLDDNLRRFRAFREQAKAAGWRQGDALNEARQPMTHEYQRAFLAIKTPETAAMMQEYLADEHFGELAARVLADQWRTANEPPKDKRIMFGVDFSGVEEKRAARAADPQATSAEAETIFAAIEPLVADGATNEQKALAVALGIAAVRLPHGQCDSTIQKLIALAPTRTRPALVLNLILSGEEIDIKIVADGISETLEAAKTEQWILTQSDGYELKCWLRLLPFVSHPTETVAVVRGMPPAQREPRFLEEMVGVLANAPSDEAEEVLFKLAEEDPRFYLNERWRAAVLRLGTPSSARRIIDLTAAGAFERVGNDWHLARELGSQIEAHPDLRSHLYGLLNAGPTTPGLALLTRAVAEAPDNDGLLLLVKFEQELNRPFASWQTIERLVTEHEPVSDWAGAYNVVPVPADSLRQKLLALTTDGGLTDAAARRMRQIDEIRDEHGMPEGEPRHPDLPSGKPWPIMQPDPDATADG